MTGKGAQALMIITLPDSSLVSLHTHTLRFKMVSQTEPRLANDQRDGAPREFPIRVNIEKLATTLQKPFWRFGDSFRRVSDHPRYSPKQSVHQFDIKYLTKIYQFTEDYQGGTFSPSTTIWSFLDGGIVAHHGYGWGSHSWTVVEGTEALRAVCLFFGVKQPQRLKGEQHHRPLARLLEDMTRVPIKGTP